MTLEKDCKAAVEAIAALPAGRVPALAFDVLRRQVGELDRIVDGIAPDVRRRGAERVLPSAYHLSSALENVSAAAAFVSGGPGLAPECRPERVARALQVFAEEVLDRSGPQAETASPEGAARAGRAAQIRGAVSVLSERVRMLDHYLDGLKRAIDAPADPAVELAGTAQFTPLIEELVGACLYVAHATPVEDASSAAIAGAAVEFSREAERRAGEIARGEG